MYTEIAPGVYDITTKHVHEYSRHRVFLVDGEAPTLFDASLADATDELLSGVEAVGIEPERLVVTHGDGDHIGGFDAVVDAYDAETWVPEQTDTDDLANEPDRRYGDGDEIDGFQAVHVPGHTPDHHVLVDEDRGVAVLGDSVMGSDRRGLPEGYFIPPAAVFSTDLQEAEKNLDRLLEYEFEVGLVYHGSSVSEGASEKLSTFVDFPGRP